MRARIVLPGAVAGIKGESIELDGFDITKACRRFSLESAVGEVNRLHLDLLVLDNTTFEGEVTVYIPDATREALVHLGWTPPQP